MSVRFRPDRNTWERSITIDGKRKRLQFSTKTEAVNYAPIIQDLERGKTITIDLAIKSYFTNVSSSKSCASSEKRYFNLMFHFLTEEKGLETLDQVRYGHMLALQKWLLEPRVYDDKPMRWSQATVNRAFHSIKHFFVHWVREGVLIASPSAHLSSLPEEYRPRRPMTHDEFKRALGEAPDWFKPAMGFIHLTGFDPAALCRFKWQDVDFENCQMVMTRKKGDRGRWRRITMPMTEAVSLLLTNHRSSWSRLKLSEPVFRNEHGKPLNADWCSKVGNRAIKAAGIKGAVLYSMRHALASDLTDANVSMEIIRQLMGHSSIRTTQRYAKPKTETLANALTLVRGEKMPPKCHQENEADTTWWQTVNE